LNILIVVGSVYGGARLVAEEIQTPLQELGCTVTIPESVTGENLNPDDIDLLLVCTSTTGAGDLPEELIALHTELVDIPPRIAGLKYAVIGLGDSSYDDTFCGGGEKMDSALADIGAERVAPLLRLDAMETVTPEDDAVPWAVKLVTELMESGSDSG